LYTEDNENSRINILSVRRKSFRQHMEEIGGKDESARNSIRASYMAAQLAHIAKTSKSEG
jgi:hypothetical protein